MRTLWLATVFVIGCSAPAQMADAGPLVETDAGKVIDAGFDAGVLDAGAVVSGPPTSCIVDNSDAGIARRDGFLEVCADVVANPDAVCGDGVPYKFSYRPATGTSAGLLLYFGGSGTCTDYVTCWGLDGRGGVGRKVQQLGLVTTAPTLVNGRTVGVFDRTDTLNSLRSYDQVFITYCTGDLGQGMQKQVMTKPLESPASAREEIDTFFHGAWDVQFALEQAALLFPAPRRVVVYGTSSGALSAVNAVPWVATAFALDSTSQLSLVTEGGMAVGRAGQEAQLARLFTQFNGTQGRPFVRVGQFSFISDTEQIAAAPSSVMLAADYQTELRRVVESRIGLRPSAYRTFLLNGTCHTVAQSPELFTQKQTGARPNPDLSMMNVSFDAWVGRIIGGTGAMDLTIPNLTGDFSVVSTTCPIAGGP